MGNSAKKHGLERKVTRREIFSRRAVCADNVTVGRNPTVAFVTDNAHDNAVLNDKLRAEIVRARACAVPAVVDNNAVFGTFAVHAVDVDLGAVELQDAAPSLSTENY